MMSEEPRGQPCGASRSGRERPTPPLLPNDPMDYAELARQAIVRLPSPGGSDPAGEHLTDQGNAERLARMHGADMRYCWTWGRWLVWDGRRFALDDTGEVVRQAKQVVRAVYAEAEASQDEDRRKALAKHALRSESAQRVAGMLALAQSEPGIPVRPHEMDANPWLFNVQNGTLDLRTGELHAHDRLEGGLRYTSKRGGECIAFGLGLAGDHHHALWLIEGEINALSLWQALGGAQGLNADVVSFGSEHGATSPAIVGLARRYRQVVVWADDREQVQASLRAIPGAFGLRSPVVQGVKLDANALLQCGALAGFARAAWERFDHFIIPR